MIAEQIEQAARLLVSAYRSGTLLDGLPHECAPETLEDGYAVQERMVKTLGFKTVGWKLGLTDFASQAAKGMNTPVKARLFADRLATSPARLPVPPGRLMIEPELVFRMGRDLAIGGRETSADEVLDSVAASYVGMELCASRFSPGTHLSVPLNLGDNSFHSGLVIGPELKTWRSIDLAAIKVELICDGVVVAKGSGAAVLGNPINALLWLANDLAREGRSLTKGEWISSGSWTGAQVVNSPFRAKAVFGGTSTVELKLDALGQWPAPPREWSF